MEYLYKVLGIKATVQRAEFDHLPNYIAVRYRLQKVSYTEKREPACRAGAKRTQLSSKGISAS